MDLDKCGEFFALYDTKEIVEFGLKTQNTLMFEKEDKFEQRLKDLGKEFYDWCVSNDRPINTVGVQMWCLRSRIPHAFRPEIIFQAKQIEKANKPPEKKKRSRKK
jgi:hypothetical protein